MLSSVIRASPKSLYRVSFLPWQQNSFQFYLACRIFISHVAFFISHVAFLSRMLFLSRIFYLACRIFYLACRIIYLACRIFLSRISHCYLASRIFYLAFRIFLSPISHFYVAFTSRNFFLLLLSRISNVPYRLPYKLKLKAYSLSIGYL